MRGFPPARDLPRLLLVALCLGLAACGTPKPVPPPAGWEVVKEYVEPKLVREMATTADRAPLEQFHAVAASARTRADLNAAWRAIPALAARPDLLERAFAEAAQDGDWPAAPDERAYVQGTRAAVRAFLDRSPR